MLTWLLLSESWRRVKWLLFSFLKHGCPPKPVVCSNRTSVWSISGPKWIGKELPQFSGFHQFNKIKLIESLLPCVCSVIDHTTSKCGKNKKVAHKPVGKRHWCFYHVLTSSVIYYWTDAWQYGIYLFYTMQKWKS